MVDPSDERAERKPSAKASWEAVFEDSDADSAEAVCLSPEGAEGPLCADANGDLLSGDELYVDGDGDGDGSVRSSTDSSLYADAESDLVMDMCSERGAERWLKAEEASLDCFVGDEVDDTVANWMRPCRSVGSFRKLDYINEGGYGVVYRAQDKQSGRMYALKRIQLSRQDDGFPVTALREICLSRVMNHPNIVRIQEVLVSHRMENIYLVMELMETDVYSLMNNMEVYFNEDEIKCIMYQFLKGLDYLHQNWVMHRDIKPSNLLISSNGMIKISDFGLARKYGSPLGEYSEQLVTLWYRPPEILNGMTSYSSAVDLWAVGCIFAELHLMRPLFKGRSELDQLDKIYTLLGTVKPEEWPEFYESRATRGVMFVEQPNCRLEEECKEIPLVALEVIRELLAHNPARRPLCRDVLSSEFFQLPPSPAEALDLKCLKAGNDHQRRGNGWSNQITNSRSTPDVSSKSSRSQVFFDTNTNVQELWDSFDFAQDHQLSKDPPCGSEADPSCQGDHAPFPPSDL